MVPDPAVVWTGHGAQLGAAVLGLERLHQFGAVRQQAVLHVDAGERRGKLTQIARRRPDQAAELTEGPVSRRHGLVAARHDQRQPLGIVAARLDPNVAGLRSEEHTSELQSLMRTTYAVLCLKKKKEYHNQPKSEDQN